MAHQLKNMGRAFNMKGSSLLIALAVCIFTFCLIPLSASASSVPELINYQGKLTDAQGQPLETGEYGLEFGIYTAASGGEVIWTEPHTKVPVVRGHFNVILGGINTSGLANRFAAPERYLEIKITAKPQGPVAPHQVIAPRQRILSTPYALGAFSTTLVQGRDIAQELDALAGRVSAVESRTNRAHERLNDIRLESISTGIGPIYSCGNEDLASAGNTIVMYGLRDGTGCGVHNRNYYKELDVHVPVE